MPSGFLIAIEGIDGAGKSTQADAVARALEARGAAVVRSREPTDGPHGRKIRATATTGRLPVAEELALFLADRSEHVRDTISPALAAGQVVVLDRYYLSTAAYQGVRGLDPVAIVAQNEAFAPRPDLLVILDLTAAQGLSRVRERAGAADLFEAKQDLMRCRQIFLDQRGPHVLVLDATEESEVLTDRIVTEVLARRT